MPISDYANAFFFARRTRVALEAKEAVSFGAKGCACVFRHGAASVRAGVSVETRRREISFQEYRTKTKARLEAGLLQSLIVGLAYFASLAI
jgi:hypothetical protein